MTPAETPPLLGVDGVAVLYGVSPSTAYSWAARGHLGTPDLSISRRSVWRRDRFPAVPVPRKLGQVDKGPRPPYPVILLGPVELSKAFHIQPRTIDAWRRRARDTQASGDLMTPEPFLTVSLTPIWIAESWNAYALARCIRYDPPTMAQWRRDQARAVKALNIPVK